MRRASTWAAVREAPRGPWVPPAAGEVEALLHDPGAVLSLLVRIEERRGDQARVWLVMELAERWVPLAWLESRAHRKAVQAKAEDEARSSAGRSVAAGGRHARSWRETLGERQADMQRELLGLERRVAALETR